MCNKTIEIMLDFFPVSRKEIDSGDFPLNHDAILKVEFFPQIGLHYQYFSCKAQHTFILVDVLSKLFCVRNVYISSVDDLPDTF